jgi:1-acyl-sn-glycerol-3-phosphate acyltransferase
MDKSNPKHPPNMLVSVLRGGRLAVHLFSGMLLAIIYPYLNQTSQRRTMKMWSKKLLDIFNIGLQIEGPQPGRGEGGCLIVANHISWLDIFVLNAIYPVRFIAKSEVRAWPFIGWLCQRSGTIFIDRATRPQSISRNSSMVNQQLSHLLKQGACIGLFPEGTTTDGKQVGHFHSALIQPAIETGTRLCPIALRYQDQEGELEIAAAFVGNMTLAQSIWKILRCPHLNALVVFTPALLTVNANRRVLARTAQAAITQGLQTIGVTRQAVTGHEAHPFPQIILSSQSAYGLLVDLNQFPK